MVYGFVDFGVGGFGLFGIIVSGWLVVLFRWLGY